MKIHDWLESIKRAPMYALAKRVVEEFQYFDIGDVSNFPYPSPEILSTAKPPFPAVALQTESKINGIAVYAITFIRCSDSAKDVFVVARNEDGRWYNTDRYKLVITSDGEWLISENSRSSEDDIQFCLAHLSRASAICAIMACSNVKHVTHEPPAALNKKRVKSGKAPLVSYKTLEIIVPAGWSQSADLGGTHASPRVHLRRGHIRRLESGKTIWVQPCVVGSKHGIVHKDYKVTQACVANKGDATR